MSAGEGRTVAELLDDSDVVAREALLDMSAGRALGMVRGWPQLMQSAAELWAVLPPDQAVSGNGDQIGILAAMGGAVGRGYKKTIWDDSGDFVVIEPGVGVVINEQGSDRDLRVEGDTDANLLMVDASTDRVGIGTATPTAFVDIKLRSRPMLPFGCAREWLLPLPTTAISGSTAPTSRCGSAG